MKTAWFGKFALDCLKRIGQIVHSDMMMSVEVLLELLSSVEAAAREARGWDRMMLLMLGAALVIGLVGSLQGHEIFLDGLTGMRKHLVKGKHSIPMLMSHVIMTLFGWFKRGDG